MPVSLLKTVKDIAWDAACFGQLFGFIIHALLGVRLLVLPALVLAQDASSPAIAQQQIESLKADLARHERKIDELSDGVQDLAVEVAVLSQHLGAAENSHSNDNLSDNMILLLVLGLVGERGLAKLHHKKKP